jgi:hypothetical protein
VESARRKAPLAAHIERAIARLSALRGTSGIRLQADRGQRSDAFLALLNDAVRELDALAADAKHARGTRRAEIVARLAELDASLVERAVEELTPETVDDLKREADAEMAPFGARMDPAARQRGAQAAFQRLVREAAGLPILTYD